MSLLNKLHKDLYQSHHLTQWVDINSIYSIQYQMENLMWKASGNIFLGHLGEWVFRIFPRLHLIIEGRRGCLLIPFKVFMDHFTVFNSSPMQHLRWSSLWLKIGNGWNLFFSVVTNSFILNLALKGLDNFRWRQ